MSQYVFTECYCCGKPGNISLDFTEAASTTKDKWALKAATKNFCVESQRAEYKSRQNHNQLKMKKKIF